MRRVECGAQTADWPIEFDCRDVVLVTSSFYALVSAALKRAPDRDHIRLTNVRAGVYKAITQCKFDKFVNIRLKDGDQ